MERSNIINILEWRNTDERKSLEKERTQEKTELNIYTIKKRNWKGWLVSIAVSIIHGNRAQQEKPSFKIFRIWSIIYNVNWAEWDTDSTATGNTVIQER